MVSDFIASEGWDVFRGIDLSSEMTLRRVTVIGWGWMSPWCPQHHVYWGGRSLKCSRLHLPFFYYEWDWNFLCLLSVLIQHRLWLRVLLYFPIILVLVKSHSILNWLTLSMPYLWQFPCSLAFTFRFLTLSCFAFSVLYLVRDFSYRFHF